MLDRQCRFSTRFIFCIAAALSWSWVASFSIQSISSTRICRNSDHESSLVLRNSYLESPGGDRDKNPKDQQADSVKTGFELGQVTRAAVGAFESKVNWAKDSVMKLDEAAKSAVLARVTAYTKKSEYKLGDLTKEVFRRFEVGEYKKEDLWLFIRICILIGGTAGAVGATALPVKVLLELLEVSMASSVSEDITSMLTNEINNRMKEFVTGDKAYQIGDVTKTLTKKFLLGEKNHEVDLSQQVIGKLTGKEVVEFSALSKKFIILMAGKKKWDKSPGDNGKEPSAEPSTSTFSTDNLSPTAVASMEDAALQEFEQWEKKYLAAMNRGNGSENTISDQDYKTWDEKLVQATGDGVQWTKNLFKPPAMGSNKNVS